MVTLNIPEDKWKYIKQTIEEQKIFIFKLKMHPLVKQETVRGLRVIESILSTSVTKEKT